MTDNIRNTSMFDFDSLDDKTEKKSKYGRTKQQEKELNELINSYLA